ncbi:MAG: pilus assembly protein CpaF [Acidimicrobiaceae bacterium]
MKLSEKLAALEEEEKHQQQSADPAPGSLAVAPQRRRSAPAAIVRKGVSTNWEATKRKVRELVLEEVAPKMKGLTGDELTSEVKSALDRILQREDVTVSPLERRKFVQEMIADTLGYGPLDPLLQDETITEIMCNSFDDIWVEREGRIENTDLAFTDDIQYRQVIEKIVSAVGRRVDESSPMVDARLPDGSRVNAIIPPLAIHGSVLTIRKFSTDPYTAKDLVNFGTYTLDLVTVMEACVRAKLNILVSGGTGTGKTTNLNVLSSFIPDGERVITIEDSAELQLQQPHVINLEARPANAEGSGEVRIRDLVKNALRMRPDRIIVGEVRAGEALDMLQAMNTGHEGSMTTVHANTARDALSRLETMVLMAGFELPVKAIREQVASALDLIMQVDRMPDGRRVVTSLTELQGLEGETILLQDIFKYRFTPGTERGKPAGELVATGLRPKFMEKLIEREIDLPASAFKPPTPTRAGGTPQPTRRRVRVPEASEIAERERLR